MHKASLHYGPTFVQQQTLVRMQLGWPRVALAGGRHQQQPHLKVQTGTRSSWDVLRRLGFPRTCIIDSSKLYPLLVPMTGSAGHV